MDKSGKSEKSVKSSIENSASNMKKEDKDRIDSYLDAGSAYTDKE